MGLLIYSLLTQAITRSRRSRRLRPATQPDQTATVRLRIY